MTLGNRLKPLTAARRCHPGRVEKLHNLMGNAYR